MQVGWVAGSRTVFEVPVGALRISGLGGVSGGGGWDICALFVFSSPVGFLCFCKNTIVSMLRAPIKASTGKRTGSDSRK